MARTVSWNHVTPAPRWSGTPGLPDGLPAARDARRELESGRSSALPEAAEMIRSWRYRLRMTQEELARALGVTLSTLNRWENGHVLPSRLAWRELEQFSTKHSCRL